MNLLLVADRERCFIATPKTRPEKIISSRSFVKLPCRHPRPLASSAPVRRRLGVVPAADRHQSPTRTRSSCLCIASSVGEKPSIYAPPSLLYENHAHLTRSCMQACRFCSIIKLWRTACKCVIPAFFVQRSIHASPSKPGTRRNRVQHVRPTTRFVCTAILRIIV
jgi:hypothetical protein